MTAAEYKAKGYAVGAYVDQAAIDRAEADVTAAYITPIIGTPQVLPASAVEVLACLSFLLLTQREIFATRSGGKTKQTLQGGTPTAAQKIGEVAEVAALKIKELRNEPNADKNARVIDICKIYFKTKYLAL